MEKKSLVLAGLRLCLFALLAASCFNLLPLSIISQVLISTGVIVSDIMDGKLSRRENNEDDKIKFRKIDTFVDKLGILSCAFGLFCTGKFPIHLALSIFGYNAVIVVGGVITMKKTKDLKEKKISGNIFSRCANLLTAVTFLLANNNLLVTSFVKNIASIILLSSFGMSIGNHYRLLKKDDAAIQNHVESINFDDNVVLCDEENKDDQIVIDKIIDRNERMTILVTDLKLLRSELVKEQVDTMFPLEIYNDKTDELGSGYEKRIK